MTGLIVRALRPAEVAGVRAMVSEQLSGTRYETRLLEQLDVASGGDDPECRALVALAPDETHVRGLALFGSVAGAQGVVKIHALAGDDHDVVRALWGAVCEKGIESATRMVVCEIADDAPFRVTTHALRELGFAEAGRVADFVRDGVDLLVLVWRSR